MKLKIQVPNSNDVDDTLPPSGASTPSIRSHKRGDRLNQYPLPIFDRVCLCISSCFFLNSAYYCFYVSKHEYLHNFGYVSMITTTCSLNFWRYPVFDNRRDIDIATARVSFLYYFISGLFYVVPGDISLLGLSLLVLAGIFGCLHISEILWESDSCYWKYGHMGFHFFVALEQYVVLLAADRALTRNSESKVFATLSTMLFSSPVFKDLVQQSIFSFLPFEVFIIIFIVFLYVLHIFLIQNVFGAHYF